MNLSFIKLDINIMNDTKIKIIRKMPEGDSILILWIGLLCLAMKSGRPGVVEIGDGIPFNDETLSIELGIPLNTVRLGFDVFLKFKMIETWDTGETYIVNFEKHQELGKIKKSKEVSRISSQKYREKLKLGDGHVTPSDDTEIDKEIDKEIEVDKDKEDSAKRVISSLNKISNKKFRFGSNNTKNIIARLKEGFTEDDCLKVLDIKIQDPHFIENPQHYNPVTLFIPKNFERYLNEDPSKYKFYKQKQEQLSFDEINNQFLENARRNK